MAIAKPLGSISILDNVPKPSLFDFELSSFEVGKPTPS
jgi:hypothetical protein